MTVITISRQFGAGGATVASLLADHLHVDIVDQSLLAEVARRAALAPADVEAEDERPTTLLDRLALSFSPLAAGIGMAWEPPYPDLAFDPRREVLQLTQDVIREAAKTGNVVIVGRGGAHILHDHPTALHVFLHADPAFRARVVMERERIDQAAAERRVHAMDANRAAYIHQVYGRDWNDVRPYHLAIDTGRLGFDGAVDLIERSLARSVDEHLAPGLPGA
ncbi:MAG: cytidylate kinase-like family protein [Chloroflexi bacterium]|nr:cytidylate kinase-like family protein [Chloroflexota bacterium]